MAVQRQRDFTTSTPPHFAKVRVAGSNPVVRSVGRSVGVVYLSIIPLQRHNPGPSIRRRGTYVGTNATRPSSVSSLMATCSSYRQPARSYLLPG